MSSSVSTSDVGTDISCITKSFGTALTLLNEQLQRAQADKDRAESRAEELQAELEASSAAHQEAARRSAAQGGVAGG